MGHRKIKDAVYGQVARIGKAVASPRRLELLDLLSQGEKTVETLAEQAGITVKNASAHLRVLRGARLVETRREAQYVHYRLAEDDVAAFFLCLRGVAERRLAEIREVEREYFGDRARMTPLDRRRLMARVERGEVTVLDVRPADEYHAGHLPGARSVPLTELQRALGSIPKDQEVVAYCRGPYCVLALEAVAILRAEGYSAVSLEEGVAEWRLAGLPLEVVSV